MTPRLAPLRLIGALLAANILAWIAALALFGSNAALLGMGLLAYVLGLRHAVDADHIAAIDNVTRKLVAAGRKPLTVGFWFSLGHSSVVALACIAIATGSSFARRHLAVLANFGALGTGVSAIFLFIIGLTNTAALVSLWRTTSAEDAQAMRLPGGPVGRLLRPVLQVTSAPWHMFPLGFLFGLGFDTASEIGLLGISATQGSQAGGIGPILIFPLLFAAGMSLVDTADGLMMLGAYGWQGADARRQRLYNLTMTGLSIVVALGVGAMEAIGLLAPRMAHWSESLDVHAGSVGTTIVALFAVLWAAMMMASARRAPVRRS